MTTQSHGSISYKSKRIAIVLLAGAVAVTGLALAGKPSGGGGGSGGGGKAKPIIALNVTSLSFGDVNLGSTGGPQTVTVTNSGTANLNFTSVSTTNGAFTPANSCPSALAAGSACTIGVTFTPTTAGAVAANLVIVTNASNTPTATVSLSGTGKSTTPPPTTVRRVEGGGDSIMRGYNASCTRNDFLGLFCYSGGDQPENSFLDGSSSSVLSLVDRYIQLDPLVSGGKAASASGSEMTDMAKNNFATQATAIVNAATQPVRVFVELGGNDICNRGTTAQLYDDITWENAVRAGLNELTSGLPDGSTVLMVSVPRVQDLRAAGIAKQQSTSGVNCENFWSSFDVCRIATASGTDLQARLAAIDARQQAYNAKLATLVAEYNGQATSTGVEVVTDYDATANASVGSYTFQPTDINGGDCFHPSLQGQNKLSQIIWNKNPYK